MDIENKKYRSTKQLTLIDKKDQKLELLKHIALGLIVIIYGVWQIVDTYKDYTNLRKSKALEYVYWKGYIIGVACIIAGVLEFFNWWGW